MPLKDAYPRLYALSINKTGPISEFGKWEGKVWRLDFQLRRKLFDWELDVWNVFTNTLAGVKMQKLVADTIAWSYYPKGLYTVSSFRRCVEDYNAEEVSEFGKVWYGFSPPKVELFIWQLLHGRILVCEVLKRYGISNRGACPLCGRSEETVDHLFLFCPWTSSVWNSCMGWWSVYCCANKSVNEWFLGWQGLCPKSKLGRAWITLLGGAKPSGVQRSSC
ncbi:hypothetical protein Dsin_004716 [Dipteronia sinensis]|uniref:Reverse transcriptase zinc-binding domain-containing protein n=1 Tax=Dipteronia sinensis TaxID=43782 RepID=A0AAE0AWL9_9ROSI|nr:hypothetical protein Dsin_004716 [Dipteronia sinensis]